MGSPSTGGLALGRGATTTVIEARHAFPIGARGWSIEGYGSIGVTRLDVASTSLITGASSLLGTRLGLQANGPAFGGLLSLGVAQPLTIESGTAHLTLPTGYDYDTMSLIYSQRNASAASTAPPPRDRLPLILRATAFSFSPIPGQRGCREALSATASRTSATNASTSIVSPSRMSIARRVPPVSPALNKPAGSGSDAPLAKVSLI